MSGSALLEAMLAGPTWFLARAEPGLGRLTESISLAGVLGRGESAGRIRFHTSAAAVPLASRLLGALVTPFDLGRGSDPQQTLIDSPGVQALLDAVSRRRPAAVVVDGYPLLLPLLRAVSPARLVAMANLHDLRNPVHSRGARLLQEALHQSADLVLVSELRRGWTRGRIGPVPLLRIPALVRAEVPTGTITTGWEGPPRVVAVLGGGSRGDHRLQASNQEVLGALNLAVGRGELPSCLVFAGAEPTSLGSGFPNLQIADDPARCLDTLAAAELVIARAGRSTLAEVLASGRRAVAVVAESDTLRGAEQAANAAAAAKLSPAVVPLPVARLDELAEACRRAMASSPRRWRPGNRTVLAAVGSI
ncbi:MAG: glycosyltransferase [Candidatus Dormibacteria bacterium]